MTIRSRSFLGMLLLLFPAIAAGQDPGEPTPRASIVFQGAVFEGEAGETERPIVGVTVSIYGSDLPYPDPGVPIRSVSTDSRGFFELAVTPADGAYLFFHIRETHLEGYVSIEARSDRGSVRTQDWVEFSAPARGDTIRGVRFWDMGPRPDLLVGVADPEIVGQADTILLAVQVWNSGNAPSAETVVRASSNGWVADQPIRSLGQRDVAKVEIRFPVSDARRGQRHAFLIEVDPEAKIPEFNEDNNTALAPPIEIPSLPDLSIDSVGIELPGDGRTVLILARVVNLGEISSPASALIASSDAWRGNADVPALDAGGAVSVRVNLPIPDGQRGREHRFAVEVDPNRLIAESDEGNNRSKTEILSLPNLPDLVVRAPRSELLSDHETLRIVMEIENLGGQTASGTTVRAISGQWQGSAQTGEIAPGTRETVQIGLAIPARQRGMSHTFRVEVDPENRVVELNDANNHGETSPITIADLPDLVIRQTGFDILADGKTLRIEIQIANIGGLRAPETVVRAGVEGWDKTAAVRSLSAGETEQVAVSLEIPPERRGKDHIFEVVVDPEERVTELNETNNSVSESTAPIPDLPDLTLEVLRLGFVDKDRALLIVGRAENVGGAPTPGSVVLVRSDGWEARTIVDALMPGDTSRVMIQIEIPDLQRGKTHSFEVRIDPADEIQELDEENNAVRTPGIDIPEQKSILPYVALGGASALIAIGALLIHRMMRRRRRKDWQEEAQEGDLPDTLRPGIYHCRKIEIDVDPKNRYVSEIVITANPTDDSGRPRVTRVGSDQMGNLNDAIRAWRKNGNSRQIQSLLSPVARDLLRRFEAWLRDEPTRFDVELSGQMDGGKATWEYILYHSERKGSADIWIEEDRWEATVRDSRVLSIGRLVGAGPAGLGADIEATESLTQQILQFVQKI